MLTRFAISFARIHIGGADATHPVSWSWEPALTLPLLALGILLLLGIVRLGKRTHCSRPWRNNAVVLGLGWLSLLLALNSPIHQFGEHLFWVHMIQHEILLLVSAPLLVLGNAWATILAALPLAVSARLAHGLRITGIQAIMLALSRPLPAWFLGAAALWIWHLPKLFDATLDSDWVHAAQHLSFLSTAFLFWLSLLESRARQASYGASILYLFTTAVHTSFLGVLLTYSARPWYSSYIQTAPPFGYTPLQDQQLGGLIMWVPAGAVFTTIALCLVPAWLRASDTRHALWSEETNAAKAEGSQP